MLLAPAAGAAPDAAAAALVAMARSWAALWILCRLVGAVVTVPLAEELAFHGYLARRLIARDFERFPSSACHGSSCSAPRSLSACCTIASSPRRLRGFAYGVVVRRRGALADAVVAHATTNALLAVWVPWTGNWSLW